MEDETYVYIRTIKHWLWKVCTIFRIDQSPGNLRRWSSYFLSIAVNRIKGMKEISWKKVEFELDIKW